MFRRLRTWLCARFADDEGADGDADAERSEPTAFSLLDASVNYSHGQHDGTAVRELQEASDRASELEDARREGR